jgi:hypothetical protein
MIITGIMCPTHGQKTCGVLQSSTCYIGLCISSVCPVSVGSFFTGVYSPNHNMDLQKNEAIEKK